ncbi:energy transducer TonB [Thermosulfuriphilus ammonigenes]|uniref:Energy transducer TonB n=1 Tax=Thermosulfuriphilus ammonigenes TaxID=1936021 RepID=A0A6G7PYN9_9BACT|nr:energy transducer TonB [Thermosulfuriphilus ammonigenes]MBA2849008.1 protein TonB [Thermosulfuriphilus ammonigenes]QIJ72697.1 energy transducer TonB [Thermosulfuriphilus ammonigenes]
MNTFDLQNERDHLIWVFLLLSALIHTLILISVPRLKRAEEEKFFEVNLAPVLPSYEEVIAPPDLTSGSRIPLTAPVSEPLARTYEAIPEIPPKLQTPEEPSPDLQGLDLRPLKPLTRPGSVKTLSRKETVLRGSRSVQTSSSPSSPLRNYLALIRDRVEAAKRYPLVARMRGEEGSVRVAFSISPRGELLTLELLKSSGHRLLDQAALSAIKKAAPFPPPPPPYEQKGLRLFLKLNFQLR